MNFRPELARAVMAGEKTVTRRLVSDNPRSPWWRERCALRFDRTYAVCPGRGKPAIGRVRIVDVRREHLGDLLGSDLAVEQTPIANREARKEGFRNAVAFKLAWLKINGGYDPEASVWRIEFARVQPSIGGHLAAVAGYSCIDCGAQIISDIPVERCDLCRSA